MLTWRQEGDGWHANGYTITLAEPFRWILTKAEPDSGPVSIPVAPLATGRTLTECKREAELLAASERRGRLRRRWAAQAGIAGSGIVFVAGTAPPWNVLLVTCLLTFVLRCLALIAGTLIAGREYTSRDNFYQ